MSSPRIPSPDPQALGSPDQRTVLDFHRQDDLNASRQAHHHDLGGGFNQGAPGTHLHDGSDSSLLPDLEAQKIATYPYSIRIVSPNNQVPSTGYGNYGLWGGAYDSNYGINSSAADVVATRIVLPYSGIWSFNLWAQWIFNAAGEANTILTFNDVPMNSDFDSMNFHPVGAVYWRSQISHSGYHPKGETVCSAYWQVTGANAGYQTVLTATLVNRTA